MNSGASIVALLCLAAATPAATSAGSATAGSVLIVLDASGSMWGRMEGRTRIEIAREATHELIGALPATTRIGLAAYGHRSKGDCDDIELLAAPGAVDRQALLQRIATIQPKGMTPITTALERAGDELATHEQEAAIVLISDGKESCDGDPCAAARRLRERGLPLRVHVVGFDVGDAEREQLACIAEAGGGSYFGADNTAELKQALTQVRAQVQAAPTRRTVKIERPPLGSIEFRNLHGGHVQIVDAASGEKRADYCNDCGSNTQVPAGSYRLKFKNFDIDGVEVAAGPPTVFDLDKVAGSLEIRNLQSGIATIVDAASGEKRGEYCNNCGSITQVPAGRYRLKFKNFESGIIDVPAGPPTPYDLDAVAGIIEFPTHDQGIVRVLDAETGEKVAEYCRNCGSNTQVPAGHYRIAFPNFEVGPVELAAGQVLVVE